MDWDHQLGVLDIGHDVFVQLVPFIRDALELALRHGQPGNFFLELFSLVVDELDLRAHDVPAAFQGLDGVHGGADQIAEISGMTLHGGDVGLKRLV